MTNETENITKYRNVHFKSDVEYVIRVARTMLTPVAIWPRNDTLINNIKLFAHSSTVFLSMCFLLIPHVIYTYFDCEDLKRYMKVIAAQVFSLLGIIKFCTMIVNRKDIGSCLEQIEMQYRDVECEEDRSVMTKYANIGRYFTILYLGLSYGGAVPYHIIVPLRAEKIVKADNTTQLPLPYLSDYVFFVIEDSPIYEITFVTQMVISTIIVSTNCGANIFIAIIAMHSCGLFEIVNRKMETFFEQNAEDLHDQLRKIVQCHLKAIEFVATIERALNPVFLSEMVGCTVLICFLEYGVLVEWQDYNILNTLTYFILMTSALVNVFILSLIGDRLKQESERVGETTYFLPWYDLPQDIAGDLRTIILRTSHPTHLTGAKLFDLSLQAFCDICKTSAAYFNFLRALTV